MEISSQRPAHNLSNLSFEPIKFTLPPLSNGTTHCNGYSISKAFTESYGDALYGSTVQICSPSSLANVLPPSITHVSPNDGFDHIESRRRVDARSGSSELRTSGVSLYFPLDRLEFSEVPRIFLRGSNITTLDLGKISGPKIEFWPATLTELRHSGPYRSTSFNHFSSFPTTLITAITPHWPIYHRPTGTNTISSPLNLENLTCSLPSLHICTDEGVKIIKNTYLPRLKNLHLTSGACILTGKFVPKTCSTSVTLEDVVHHTKSALSSICPCTILGDGIMWSMPQAGLRNLPSFVRELSIGPSYELLRNPLMDRLFAVCACDISQFVSQEEEVEDTNLQEDPCISPQFPSSVTRLEVSTPFLFVLGLPIEHRTPLLDRV